MLWYTFSWFLLLKVYMNKNIAGILKLTRFNEYFYFVTVTTILESLCRRRVWLALHHRACC